MLETQCWMQTAPAREAMPFRRTMGRDIERLSAPAIPAPPTVRGAGDDFGALEFAFPRRRAPASGRRVRFRGCALRTASRRRRDGSGRRSRFTSRPDFPGGYFLALVLAPDLAMLAYLAGPRWGSIVYNLAHTTAPALSLALAGFLAGAPIASAAGLIWIAHIGLDRALGYGLKYSSGFGDTHLGPIGRG